MHKKLSSPSRKRWVATPGLIESVTCGCDQFISVEGDLMSQIPVNVDSDVTAEHLRHK